MARKESTKQRNEAIPTIIGAGITEKWYFTHLQAKYRVRMKNVNTNRHFGTSRAVITELVKYIKEFDKTETFLKNQKWADDMSADGRIETAAQRAVNIGTNGESYTNVWKAMQELHIVELEASHVRYKEV